MEFQPSATTFDDLPQDILEVIAGKVAADRYEDVVNLKLTSKALNEAGKSYQVMMHANLESFEIAPWQSQSEEEELFLLDCMKWNNPHAYFRTGMHWLFGLEKLELGFSMLYTAYLLGHREAAYTAGLILIGTSEEFHMHGLILLNTYKTENPDWIIPQSRYKVEKRLNEMWVSDAVIPHLFVSHCNVAEHTIGRIRDLEHYEDLEMESCWYCSWYHEYIIFSRMFGQYI